MCFRLRKSYLCAVVFPPGNRLLIEQLTDSDTSCTAIITWLAYLPGRPWHDIIGWEAFQTVRVSAAVVHEINMTPCTR